MTKDDKQSSKDNDRKESLKAQKAETKNTEEALPDNKETKAKQGEAAGAKKSKNSKSQKQFYQSPKFWIIAGVVTALIAIVVVVALVLYNEQHKKAVARYTEAWENYANIQNEFGYDFGVMLAEMGFSMDGSTQYELDEDTIYELARECARKTSVYDEIYNNPFASEDKEISGKSLSHILTAVDTLTVNTEKIKEAKENVEQCKEIGQEKKDKIDKEKAEKEAEEKAKAEEEAEKARQKEEAQAAYRRNVLTYDKFNNQIKEGMSLNAVKEVYGWFDTQCKVASQSGSYVIYSCTPGAHTSDYWVASFTFYNNVLRSKAQTGLD